MRESRDPEALRYRDCHTSRHVPGYTLVTYGPDDDHHNPREERISEADARRLHDDGVLYESEYPPPGGVAGDKAGVVEQWADLVAQLARCEHAQDYHLRDHHPNNAPRSARVEALNIADHLDLWGSHWWLARSLRLWAHTVSPPLSLDRK